MTAEFFQRKYGYEVDGVWMPRVTAITSVCSRVSEFPGISSYADWGSAVHEGIGQILKEEQLSCEEKILPSLRAFSAWKESVAFEARQEDIERRVVNRDLRYAGTIDLFCSIDGRKGILDIKTGTTLRKEFALQTAAYMHAYNQESPGGEYAETRWILRVDQFQECLGCEAKRRERGRRPSVAGGNPFCNHQWGDAQGMTELAEIGEHQQDVGAFLSAKELWEWFNRDWLRQIPGYPIKLFQKVLI